MSITRRVAEPRAGARRGRGGGPLGRFLRGAAQVVLPATCLACSGPATGSGHLGLCLACRGRLGRPAPGCATCGAAIRAAALARLPEGWSCGECLRRPPAFEVLRVPWSYEDPMTAVVRALKFRRLEYLGRHLALDVRELLRGGDEAWDLVVPVPLHWRRRWLRGYNQAERIARPLAALLGAPLADALRRRRATRPQTGLARTERLANLRDAFVARPRSVRGRRILLVDDVVTTGSTLEAAARALRGAGAVAVTAAAAARTPDLEAC